jgi:hypothetical protein
MTFRCHHEALRLVLAACGPYQAVATKTGMAHPDGDGR